MKNKNPIKDRFLILKIWKHLSKEKKNRILFYFIIMILSGFAELVTVSSVIPFLTVLLNPEKLLNLPISFFLERILYISESQDLYVPIIALFGICVILSTSLRLYNLHLNYDIAASVGAELSVKTFSNNLHQSYEFHLINNSSRLISQSTTFINQTVASISNFFILISNIILSIALSVSIFLINGKVSIYLLIIFILVYFYLGKTVNKEVRVNSKIIASSEELLVKSIQEVLGSIRDILLNSNQNLYTSIHKNIEVEKRKKQARNQFIGEFPRYGIEGLALLIVIIISLFSIRESTQSTSLIIFLGGFVLGIQRLLPSIQRIYLSFVLLTGYNADLLNTLEMLELKVKKLSPDILPLDFKKSIKFKNVSYSYNKKGTPVIKNLNLEIYKGQKIGLIGRTGSGKSTFIDLLMGLLQPTSGSITVDNKDIYEESFPNRVNEWKLAISHVPQDVFLADCSIAENIAFGISKDQSSMKKIKEAAKISQIDEFIESKSDGYNLRVGEKGVQLSGGQKQRIGISRALYKNTEVLIFDEATSALDNLTEVKLIKNIENLSDKKTIIAIAHRHSTLKNFDRIFKLENGSIISEGSPKEMFNQNET